MAPENQPSGFVLELHSIIRSMNIAVAGYDEAAVLQKIVAERLYERLDLVKITPKVILELGCGTGVLCQQLQKRYKKAKVYGIDLAWQRCALGAKNRKWLAKQRYICADAQSLPLKDHSVDLIFSNLMLPWIINPDPLFSELQRVLKPGGLIMFTSFGPDTLKEMRDSWASVDDHIHVNRFMDMHDIGDSLNKNGFDGVVMDSEVLTMNFERLSDLHSDLRQLGYRNINQGRMAHLMGKKRWQRYCEAYESYQNSDGEYPSTWEISYGHAWASDRRLAKPGKLDSDYLSRFDSKLRQIDIKTL